MVQEYWLILEVAKQARGSVDSPQLAQAEHVGCPNLGVGRDLPPATCQSRGRWPESHWRPSPQPSGPLEGPLAADDNAELGVHPAMPDAPSVFLAFS